MARGLSSRESNILIVCVLLAFAYGGYNFIYKPLQENTETLQSKIIVAEKRLRNQLKILGKGKSVKDAYEKYSSYFRQDASDEQEMTSLLSSIESVANDIGVHITDIKPKRVRRVDFYNHFSATLTIEGELAEVIRFLHILQNVPYLFKADEVYLEKSSLRSSQMRCRLVLSKVSIP